MNLLDWSVFLVPASLAALALGLMLLAWRPWKKAAGAPAAPRLLMPCSCQHECHLDRHALSPKGQPGHAYQMRFPLDVLVGPKEAMVCPACASDCEAGR